MLMQSLENAGMQSNKYVNSSARA